MLPFEVNKKHKSNTKYKWKSRGLIFTTQEFQTIYERYIKSSFCELCGIKYKNSRDRHMDHDHSTGKFRNIVCCKCNTWKSDKKSRPTITGERFITTREDKCVVQGFLYIFQFSRSGKNIIHKASKDLEKIIEFRNKFIDENPQYFK